MSLVDYLNQLKRKGKPEVKASNWSESSGEGHSRAHSRKFQKLILIHRQSHKEPEFPIIMADYSFMQDSPGGELFTVLDMLDVALGMMAAISVEEKGPSHLRAWGRKKVIFRIDGEPAIRGTGRCDSTRQKRRKPSSNVDQSIPHHRWARLRT